MSVKLAQSYSRGAWFATFCGLAYLVSKDRSKKANFNGLCFISFYCTVYYSILFYAILQTSLTSSYTPEFQFFYFINLYNFFHFQGKPFFFTFFISNEVKLHPTDSLRAQEFISKHLGGLLSPPHSQERYAQLGPFKESYFEVQEIPLYFFYSILQCSTSVLAFLHSSPSTYD